VIQRLASLLKDKATAKAEASAAKSQAESASRTAELLIDQNKENEEKGKKAEENQFLASRQKLKSTIFCLRVFSFATLIPSHS
jgi:hypothetical protein